MVFLTDTDLEVDQKKNVTRIRIQSMKKNPRKIDVAPKNEIVRIAKRKELDRVNAKNLKNLVAIKAAQRNVIGENIQSRETTISVVTLMIRSET